MSRLKKAISLLLVVVMVLSILPVGTFADDTDQVPQAEDTGSENDAYTGKKALKLEGATTVSHWVNLVEDTDYTLTAWVRGTGTASIGIQGSSEQDPGEQDPDEQDPDEQDPDEQDPDEQVPSEQDLDEQDPSEQVPSEQDPSEQDPSEQVPGEQVPSGNDTPSEMSITLSDAWTQITLEIPAGNGGVKQLTIAGAEGATVYVDDIVLSAADGKNLVPDPGFETFASLTEEVINSEDSRNVYKGEWDHHGYDGIYINGDCRVGNSGDELSLSFVGTWIEWNHLRNNDLGLVDISIDGTLFQDDYNTSGDTREAAVLTLGDLGAGVHTITLNPTNSITHDAFTIEHWTVSDGGNAEVIAEPSVNHVLKVSKDVGMIDSFIYRGDWYDLPNDRTYTLSFKIKGHGYVRATYSNWGNGPDGSTIYAHVDSDEWVPMESTFTSYDVVGSAMMFYINPGNASDIYIDDVTLIDNTGWNWVMNGDFEGSNDGEPRWNTNGIGYEVVEESNTPTEVLAKPAAAENNALMIPVSNNATAPYARQEIGDLEQNTEYEFSCWINGGASITLQVNDSEGESIASQVCKAADGWTRAALTFNTGEDTDVQVVLYDNCGGTDGSAVYVDNACLKKAETTENLLQNPGFDTLDNWSIGDQAGGYEWTLESAASPAKALRLTNQGTNNNGMIYSRPGWRTVNGETYTVSYKIKGHGNVYTTCIGWWGYRWETVDIDQWTEQSYTFTGTGEWATFAFHVDPGNRGDIYIADLSIKDSQGNEYIYDRDTYDGAYWGTLNNPAWNVVDIENTPTDVPPQAEPQLTDITTNQETDEVLNASNVHGGTCSTKIITGGPTVVNRMMVGWADGITPNTAYNLSFWMKGQGAVQIRFQKSGERHISFGTALVENSNADGWTQYIIPWTSPENVYDVDVGIVDNVGVANSILYFDDFVLAPADDPSNNRLGNFNPGFEAGTFDGNWWVGSGLNRELVKLIDFTTETEGNADINAKDVHGGSYSLKLVTDGSVDRNRFLATNAVAVEAGEKYYFSVWVKGAGTAEFMVRQSGHSDTIYDRCVLTGAADVWTKYTIPLVMPDSFVNDRAEIDLSFSDNQGVAGSTIYFDDMSLVKDGGDGTNLLTALGSQFAGFETGDLTNWWASNNDAGNFSIYQHIEEEPEPSEPSTPGAITKVLQINTNTHGVDWNITGYQEPLMDVKAGTEYTLSFWVKGSGDYKVVFNNVGNGDQGYTASGTASDTWTKVSTTYVAAEDSAAGNKALVEIYSLVTTETVYIDDISIMDENGTEYITNGGFENDFSDWTGCSWNPSEFAIAEIEGHPTEGGSTDPSEPTKPNHVLAVTAHPGPDANNPSIFLHQNGEGVTDGMEYTITFWVKGQGTARVTYGNWGNGPEGCSVYAEATDEWTKVTSSFVADNTIKDYWACPAIYAQYTEGGGTLYIDNFSVVDENGVEYVENGDFENGENGWSGGWEGGVDYFHVVEMDAPPATEPDEPTPPVVDPINHVLKMEAANSGAWVATYTGAAIPNATYTLTFRAKGNANIEVVAGDGNYQRLATASGGRSEEWQTYTTTFTNTDYAGALNLFVYDTSGETGLAFVDDIVLSIGEEEVGWLDFENGWGWDSGTGNKSIIPESEISFEPAPETPPEETANHALAIAPGAAHNDFVWSNNASNQTEDGKEYTISFWIKGEGQIRVTYGHWGSLFDQTCTATSEWKQYTGTFTGSSEWARPVIYATIPAAGGIVYIDDLSVVDADGNKLVVNGDFESADGWLDLNTNKYITEIDLHPDPEPVEPPVEPDPEEKNHVLHVSTTQSAHLRTDAVVPNGTYHFSVKAKGTGVLHLGLRTWADAETDDSVQINPTLGENWALYEGDITTEKGGLDNIYLEMENGEAWIDDLVITDSQGSVVYAWDFEDGLTSSTVKEGFEAQTFADPGNAEEVFATSEVVEMEAVIPEPPAEEPIVSVLDSHVAQVNFDTAFNVLDSEDTSSLNSTSLDALSYFKHWTSEVLKPDTEYTVKVWARAVGGQNATGQFLLVADPTGALGEYYTVCEVGPQWQEYTFTAMTNVNRWLDIRIMGAGVTGPVQFDSIRLYETGAEYPVYANDCDEWLEWDGWKSLNGDQVALLEADVNYVFRVNLTGNDGWRYFKRWKDGLAPNETYTVSVRARVIGGDTTGGFRLMANNSAGDTSQDFAVTDEWQTYSFDVSSGEWGGLDIYFVDSGHAGTVEIDDLKITRKSDSVLMYFNNGTCQGQDPFQCEVVPEDDGTYGHELDEIYNANLVDFTNDVYDQEVDVRGPGHVIYKLDKDIKGFYVDFDTLGDAWDLKTTEKGPGVYAAYRIGGKVVRGEEIETLQIFRSDEVVDSVHPKWRYICADPVPANTQYLWIEMPSAEWFNGDWAYDSFVMTNVEIHSVDSAEEFYDYNIDIASEKTSNYDANITMVDGDPWRLGRPGSVATGSGWMTYSSAKGVSRVIVQAVYYQNIPDAAGQVKLEASSDGVNYTPITLSAAAPAEMTGNADYIPVTYTADLPADSGYRYVRVSPNGGKVLTVATVLEPNNVLEITTGQPMSQDAHIMSNYGCDLKENTDYTVTLRGIGNTSVNVVIGSDVNGKWSRLGTVTVGRTNEWKEFTFTFNTGSHSGWGTLVIYDESEVTGKVFLDDIIVTENGDQVIANDFENGLGDSWIANHGVVWDVIPESQISFDPYVPGTGNWKVDTFGQIEIADFPEKIKEEDDFVSAKEEDNAWWDSIDAPTDLDIYGGLEGSGEDLGLDAKGFFYVTKLSVNGVLKSIMVDPLGNLYFDNGPNGIGYVEETFTQVTGREDVYQWLPSRSDATYGAAWKGYDNFSFFIANQIRSNGSWSEESFVAQSVEWMKKLGFTAAGAWSNERVNGQLPYYQWLNMPKIMISDGSTLYDIFNPEMIAQMDANFARDLPGWSSDPYIVGYLFANELHYGDLKRGVPATKGSECYSKQELIAQLQEKYATIEAFNTAWNVSMDSWEAATEASLPVTTAAADIDMNLFTAHYLDELYRQVAETARKYDKNHMLAGDRWLATVMLDSNLRRALCTAAGKYMDVLSYNYYTYTLDMDMLAEMYDATGEKPFIFTEFHYGDPTTGLTFGVRVAEDEMEKGLLYRNYVENAAASGMVVGTNWFIYLDQAPTGRYFEGLSGEAGAIGLLNVAGRPYKKFLTSVKTTNDRIYGLIQGTESPFQHEFDEGEEGAKTLLVDKAQTAPEIGKFTEWPVEATVLDTNNQIGGAVKEGNAAQIKIMWDETYFYIQAHIDDETPMQNWSAVNDDPAGIWNGDALELFIGVNDVDNGGLGWDTLGDHQLLMSAAKDDEGKVRLVHHWSDKSVNNGKTDLVKMAAEMDADGKGYTIEARFEFKALGMSTGVQTGTRIRFDMGFNDGYDGSRKHQYVWNATEEGNSSNRLNWGMMQLVEHAEETEYYQDISDFRSDPSNYKYPTKDGYIFAGWYRDPECTQPVGTTKVEGPAYAKFVEEAVLSVKWQEALPNAMTPGRTAFRFITTVDSLAYREIGFDVWIDGRHFQRMGSKVYTKVYGTDNNKTVTYLPSIFDPRSKYMIVYTIKNIPLASADKGATVTPIWVTLDGTRVEGTTKIIPAKTTTEEQGGE